MPSKTRLVTLIPIRKMNRAVKFYTKTLGGKLAFRGRGSMRDMWASISLFGSDVWLIAPDKRERRTMAYSTLLVGNIKATVKNLQRHGVKFQRAEKMGEQSRVEGSITFEPFGASAFFKDSEGNLMMVWQNFPAM
jgi:predicted enzyme related to lactoylglutathione lyase